MAGPHFSLFTSVSENTLPNAHRHGREYYPRHSYSTSGKSNKGLHKQKNPTQENRWNTQRSKQLPQVPAQMMSRGRKERMEGLVGASRNTRQAQTSRSTSAMLGKSSQALIRAGAFCLLLWLYYPFQGLIFPLSVSGQCWDCTVPSQSL